MASGNRAIVVYAFLEKLDAKTSLSINEVNVTVNTPTPLLLAVDNEYCKILRDFSIQFPLAPEDVCLTSYFLIYTNSEESSFGLRN